MNPFDKYIPEYIRNLGGYIPGKPIHQAERESGVRAIKLASNENPFGPSPKALQAMREAAADVNFYPDNENYELKHALANKHNLSPEYILAIDGTTALIDILSRVLLAAGLNAVSSERTFIVYEISVKAAGGRLIQVPMKEDTFNLDAIAAAINDKTRLVLLANPNNPTGTMFDATTLDAFIAKVPEDVVVALDEAYCDFGEYFANKRGFKYSNSLRYVRERPNVIVLRTFSKTHGLAGMRVGYGMGNPEFLRVLSRVRSAFSVSAIAEAAAVAAMQDEAHIRKTLDNNAQQAELLTKFLRDSGARVVPTSASFIYFEIAEDAGAFAKRLQSEGVIIRPLGAWGVRNGLRVTIGTPQQNQKFIEAFKKVAPSVVSS